MIVECIILWEIFEEVGSLKRVCDSHERVGKRRGRVDTEASGPGIVTDRHMLWSRNKRGRREGGELVFSLFTGFIGVHIHPSDPGHQSRSAAAAAEALLERPARLTGEGTSARPPPAAADDEFRPQLL